MITVNELMERLSDEFVAITDTKHDDKWLDKKVLKCEAAKNIASAMVKVTILQLKAAEMGGQNEITLLGIPEGQIVGNKKSTAAQLLN